ncbi:E3 ubiquitin-protein ligase TRIM38-like [Alosa sapidissima]|uniref:E3 ubiquitin-protein ligase TRIM38-like n=1 Tax=Alosa sapidissima TaxID=34773 RepID=UPI001C08BCB1|nr:E3 ubiquitin-protein ligase TRIM38-like [Alosa sapidissima]
MSVGIYEDPDSSNINIRPNNNTENIYMNAVPKRSGQRMKHSEIQDHSGGRNHGPYKLVFLGLLCVLLLAAIIIGLCIKTEEAGQVQLRYNNLTEEMDQLEMVNNNLNRENKQLQSRNNVLKCLLETNISAMVGERDELQFILQVQSGKERLQYAVDVTLDPETAYYGLVLSADGKQVRRGSSFRSRSSKQFKYFGVQGKEGFSSGRFYYEVQVNRSADWWKLGVVRESGNRTTLDSTPENGYWILQNINNTYYAYPNSILEWFYPKEKPEIVGAFVDYEGGLVSFYDAERWSLMYSYRGVSFKEKVYPYFFSGLEYYSLIITTPVCITP